MRTHPSFPRPAASPSPGRAAFTLIELLTVIAIIGVLAAIIVPTVGAVRASARASQCASNLRQLGVATTLFAADNRDRLPRRTWEFVFDLWPYAQGAGRPLPVISGNPPPDLAGTVFECPAVGEDASAVKRSYAMNARLLGPVDSVPEVRTRDLKMPSITLLMGDVLGGSQLYRTTLNPRHRGRVNLLYADGHVAGSPLTPELVGADDSVYWTPLWLGR